jgi:hypothetical protein
VPVGVDEERHRVLDRTPLFRLGQEVLVEDLGDAMGTRRREAIGGETGLCGGALYCSGVVVLQTALELGAQARALPQQGLEFEPLYGDGTPPGRGSLVGLRHVLDLLRDVLDGKS